MSKEKNSVILEVGGRTYELKMKHKAIAIAETKLDKGLMGLVFDFQRGEGYKISDLWVLIWACVNVQNSKMTFDKFLEEVEESDVSFGDLVGIASNLLLASFPIEKKGNGESNPKN